MHGHAPVAHSSRAHGQTSWAERPYPCTAHVQATAVSAVPHVFHIHCRACRQLRSAVLGELVPLAELLLAGPRIVVATSEHSRPGSTATSSSSLLKVEEHKHRPLAISQCVSVLQEAHPSLCDLPGYLRPRLATPSPTSSDPSCLHKNHKTLARA